MLIVIGDDKFIDWHLLFSEITFTLLHMKRYGVEMEWIPPPAWGPSHINRTGVVNANFNKNHKKNWARTDIARRVNRLLVIMI